MQVWVPAPPVSGHTDGEGHSQEPTGGTRDPHQRLDLCPAQADSGAAPGPRSLSESWYQEGPGSAPASAHFILESQTQSKEEFSLPTPGPCPDILPTALRRRAARQKRPMGSRPRALPPAPPAFPPADSPGPREAPSPKVAQLRRSRRRVLTWGPRRQECAGLPRGRRGSRRPGFGRRSPRCLPGARRAALHGSARTEGGGSELHSPAGAVAELAAPGLLSSSGEARSSGAGVGAKGRGGSRVGPRGAAGPEGASEEPGSARGPGHPLARWRAGAGGRGGDAERSRLGDGERKAF